MTTVVLIHAAATDSWYWHPLTAELESRGAEVSAVDLPVDDDAKGLDDYADVVVDALGHAGTTRAGTPGPLIVVGHSFGGFTAPIVADRLDADLLIMLQAQIPVPGEAPGDWWENTGHAQALEEETAGGMIDPMELMLHRTPAHLAREALSHQREQSAAPFMGPWPLPAWPRVPTRVLITADDRFFPRSFMTRVAVDRLGITPEVMPGDHCPMLSNPAELSLRVLGSSPSV